MIRELLGARIDNLDTKDSAHMSPKHHPPRAQVIAICRRIRETAVPAVSMQAFADRYFPGKTKGMISHFESGERNGVPYWPRDADDLIAAYADLYGTTALAIWQEALEMWADEEGPERPANRAALRLLVDGLVEEHE